MKNIFRASLLFFLGSLITAFFNAPLFASITLEPYMVEVKAVKGSSFSSSWSLTNNYQRDITVKITSRESGSYQGNKDLPVDSWLKISPQELTIKKGETAKIDYSVSASSAMEGSARAFVSFAVLPEEGGSLTLKMTIPAHLIVKDTENISFSVKEANLISSDKNFNVALSIENDGNILIKPCGKISIYGKKNKLIAQKEIKITPQTRSLLTGESRIYEAGFLKGLQKGKYKIRINLYAFGYETAPAVSKEIEFKVGKDANILWQKIIS